MNRVRTSLLLMAALVLMFGGVRQVKAVDIMTNGSFETGDFTGWGTKDIARPFYTLDVRVAGTSPPEGLFLADPTDGSFAATHGFDGGGPDTIEIFQDVSIPAGHSAILTFDWRAGWNFTLGIPATVRILDLVVEPAGGGSPLSTTNILTADPAVNMVLLDTGPNSDSIDLSAFAGSSIRINFLSTIPDNFSGPAHLQIDNVVLDIQVLKLSCLAAKEIKQVIIQKYEMLETIDEMLEKEWTAYETLQEMLESGDYEDLNKDDIVKARQKIHSAMQHQEQSIDSLEQSIEKMIDALSAMGYEFNLPNVIITYPEDGAEFGHTQTIEIEADACDVGGSVVKVEFFANGNKIGEDNNGTDGWKTNWDIHPVGTYDLAARATDNDGAATTSPIVTITLFESPLPGLAINPNPPDGAIDIAVSTDLSWTAGINAVSHDVYFGTTSPGTFRGNRSAATFDPGIMSYNKTYYWRIDSVNIWGTATGTVWSFTTRALPPKPAGLCFPGDTPVWVNGALEQISRVSARQEVGKLESAGLTVCLKQIESVEEYDGTYVCHDIVLETGNRITVVDSHRFLVDSGQWVPVQNLRNGTRLVSLKGTIGIKSIVKRHMPFVGKVYNLKIKGGDRYFVGKDGVAVRDY